jgi:hypothetical protein
MARRCPCDGGEGGRCAGKRSRPGAGKVGLHRVGHTSRWILGLRTGVAVASAAAAAIGYAALGGEPPEVITVTQAFAAGAIPTMLADTMVPDRALRFTRFGHTIRSADVSRWTSVAVLVP